MKAIERVILFNKNGQPLVMFEFGHDVVTADPTLISGFLTAITSFSDELFNSQSNMFIISHDQKILTVFRKEDLILCVIGQDEVKDLANDVFKAMDFFVHNYNTNEYKVMPEQYYNNFKFKLIKTFFKIPIAPDWIPKWRTQTAVIRELTQRFPFLNKIDGKTSIKDIMECQDVDFEKMNEILHYLYYYKHISFENMIEPRDYVYLTPELRGIMSDENKYIILKGEFRDVKLSNILEEIENLEKIIKIVKKYGESALLTIRLLFAKGLVGIVDNRNRNKILFFDVMQDILDIIADSVKKKDFENDIKDLIKEMDFPMITRNVKVENGKAIIDKSFLNNFLMERRDININMDNWTEFIEKLSKRYFKKEKKKIVQKIHGRLLDFYMPYCHDDEMDVLDAFLRKIEEMY